MQHLNGVSPYVPPIMLSETDFRELGQLSRGVISHRAFAAIKEAGLATLMAN